jgi:plasmid maintenance system antidote protein VapI
LTQTIYGDNIVLESIYRDNIGGFKLIGLEYILQLHGMQHQELADKLDIKKQNINLWIKEKQKVSKKHLPKLSEIFGVSEELFQMEVTDSNKLIFQRALIDQSINNVTSFDEASDLKHMVREKAIKDNDFALGMEIHELNYAEDMFLIKEKLNKVLNTDNWAMFDGEDIPNCIITLLDIILKKNINLAILHDVLETIENYNDFDNYRDIKGLEDIDFDRELIKSIKRRYWETDEFMDEE